MSDETQGESLYAGFAQVNDLVENVKCESLRPVATAFVENLFNAEGMLALPHAIVGLARKLMGAESPEDDVQQLLAHSLAHDANFRLLFHRLCHAITFGFWTAFECVAGDVWEVAVNVEPGGLWKTASEEKTLGVATLAKYGFDLRACLGTVLKSKFDFTGVSGIRKAYLKTFGDSPVVEKALNDPNLSFLEACRNVVAHKAGIIDEMFLKRVQRTGRVYTVGSKLEIDRSTLTTFRNTNLVAGLKLRHCLLSCSKTT
jgi:hypothetical protein